jgi:uncharacterized FAD-dependent dehydrogenase
MELKINGLTLALGEGEERLPIRVAALLGVSPEALKELRVIRKSLDARRARPPRFVYHLTVRLAEGISVPLGAVAGVAVSQQTESSGEMPTVAPALRLHCPLPRPIVVGCGPAGLFAALFLSEQGIPVLLLERGKAVPERIGDIRDFWEKGILNFESHVHFGEGGAGTFSDGKLTSRVKNPYTGWIKRVMADLGAPSEILTEARPHIGTDRLRAVVVRLRRRLVERGCDVRFGTRVTDFIVREGGLVGIVVNDSEEIVAERLILAIGQSADDTYGTLAARGIALQPKPFAVGFRIEHPQEAINGIQYGCWAGHPDLPPADYFLTAALKEMGRSVYSFCMCPGGSVIGCSVREGGVITNGMSAYLRDSPYANSAVVVNVGIEDLGGEGPLAGLAFRSRWEEKAFLAGGGGYCAPVQRLTDFLSGKGGRPVGRTSYLPGVRPADLGEVLPSFVIEALKGGFAEFERKMPGFITAEAVLFGVETRTSSPVRIVRDDSGQSATVKGLFPCGEGAGYAGGIISSALDGIRAAERLLKSLDTFPMSSVGQEG